MIISLSYLELSHHQILREQEIIVIGFRNRRGWVIQRLALSSRFSPGLRFFFLLSLALFDGYFFDFIFISFSELVSLHVIYLETFYFLQLRIIHPFEILSPLSEIIHVDNLVTAIKLSSPYFLILLCFEHFTRNFRHWFRSQLLLFQFGVFIEAIRVHSFPWLYGPIVCRMWCIDLFLQLKREVVVVWELFLLLMALGVLLVHGLFLNLL